MSNIEIEKNEIIKLPDHVFLQLTKQDILIGYNDFLVGKSYPRETLDQLRLMIASKLTQNGFVPSTLPYFKLIEGETRFDDYFAVYGAGDVVICIRRGVTYFIDVFDYTTMFNKLSQKLDQTIKLYNALINIDSNKQKVGQSILNIKSIISNLDNLN